ncbi:hypothetical protein R3P38DRAFT_3187552 [Favolaschia claudopus]|uniref:Uncharacterized protein n=1 Tax=Favolaschia claudopus TaxID=2862362 RepID=A0AAW0BXD8_9AGAR
MPVPPPPPPHPATSPLTLLLPHRRVTLLTRLLRLPSAHIDFGLVDIAVIDPVAFTLRTKLILPTTPYSAPASLPFQTTDATPTSHGVAGLTVLHTRSILPAVLHSHQFPTCHTALHR